MEQAADFRDGTRVTIRNADSGAVTLDSGSAQNATRALKNAELSARILAYVVNGGATIQQAMDWVLGPGYYGALAAELYAELRAKAGGQS